MAGSTDDNGRRTELPGPGVLDRHHAGAAGGPRRLHRRTAPAGPSSTTACTADGNSGRVVFDLSTKLPLLGSEAGFV